MKVDSSLRAPAAGTEQIPVRYVVLHYTAVPLQQTLEIFFKPDAKVAAHLVIDTDGAVYELIPCLNGVTFRGAHAGVSRLVAGDVVEEGVNNSSIGIEMVNINGNAFPYTDAQYEALREVMGKLKERYPALNDPASVIGHEQIAGFRGKVDPGRCFDWGRFYGVVYPGRSAPTREPVCPDGAAEQLRQLFSSVGVSWDDATGRVVVPPSLDPWFSAHLSSLLEGLCVRHQSYMPHKA